MLLSIAFNISHASIIAFDDHHEHCTVSQYVSEQIQSDDCGDICDFHHIFHFIAIITSEIPLKLIYISENPRAELLAPQPPFNTTQNKPPIA
ncbi:hypothetical protein MNB_SV-5-1080 [hydrothermal vent metagenome]|uniref:Uncharacterized protein n=1 Tax=hydrothermal vent metagenome TaxID=652676 RepID=A0A1W1EFR3_9ZZZZ